MTLEQMQREGRELIGHLEVDDVQADLDDGKGTQVWDGKDYLILALDRHTANTWKAAQESMKKSILESGLLEAKPAIANMLLDDEVFINHGMDGVRGHNTLARNIKEFISNNG